jgi:hypothetical protein
VTINENARLRGLNGEVKLVRVLVDALPRNVLERVHFGSTSVSLIRAIALYVVFIVQAAATVALVAMRREVIGAPYRAVLQGHCVIKGDVGVSGFTGCAVLLKIAV